MLGLSKNDTRFLLLVVVLTLATPILLQPFPEGSGLAQFNAGYPDLMQRFAIYGIFAIGFNILFGLTGYLSFGHAAFLGVGSYSVVWMYKLLDFNVLPGLVLAVVVSGDLCAVHRLHLPAALRHLLFDPDARLRPDVLQPRLFGADAAHQWRDGAAGLRQRPAGADGPGSPTSPHLFGLVMNDSAKVSLGDWVFTFNVGYYFTADHRDRRLLPLAAHLPLALRHDPAGHQDQPHAPQLRRHQHPALYAERLRDLGHVCRAGRRPAGGDGPAGGRRAHAVDRFGRSRADDHPRAARVR